MNSTKNSITVVLMISSLILLVVLQVLWLRSSYEKAFVDLRRQSSFLFRTAVFNFRDSVFASSIEPMVDSSDRIVTIKKFDAEKVNMFISDSLANPEADKTISQVKIFVSSTRGIDTTQDILRPLAKTLRDVKTSRSFSIRIAPDTLNRDTLSRDFKKLLRKSDLGLPFLITHQHHPASILHRGRNRGGPEDRPQSLSPYRDTLITERVEINPAHSYTATFPEIRTFIIKEIAPQFLFSIILTAIIVASFILMYRTLRSQERLMKIKNDFISNVTHELKTPVATVSVALEALRDFNALENPERAKEYLSIAQGELNRLSLMTDKILKASVFESQGINFIPENVDLRNIVEEVIQSMKLVFEKKSITISFSAEGENFSLRGSAMHLTNVVYNLLDNALKYSGENTTVSIRLNNTQEQLMLTVRDMGIGIPAAYHHKIFEKFFRVPTGDVHNVKGYGLGLNYVASVVKSHQGEIAVESSPGRGSMFTVSIARVS